jgi:hypothetical protein
MNMYRRESTVVKYEWWCENRIRENKEKQEN